MADQRRELLQVFIANLPDYAVTLLDVDGIVLTWNAGGRKIFGYDSQEIIGRHISHLYAKASVAAAPSAALDAARTGGWYEETRLACKDGTPVAAASTLMALHGPQQRLMGFGLLTPQDTEEGAGAARRFFRTAAFEAASAIGTSPRRRHLPEGQKILVVDDDPEGCRAAFDRLTSLGYRVMTASDGAEALDLLSRHPDIDLLFTDVVMPRGLSGRELADRAREAHPGLKVLFASGYFEGALIDEGRLEASGHLVVKPYRQDDLAQKLEEVLGLPVRRHLQPDVGAP
jgi:PAS domain S-box-containing protein